MLYGDWVGRWGRASPEKEALVDTTTGKRFTYGELAEEVHRMAGFLRGSIGVEKGDRVAIISANRAEYVVLFFAASRLGAVLVPLNTRLAPAELPYFFEDAEPKALFFDAAHSPAVESVKAAGLVEHVVCLDDDDRLGTALPPIWDELSAEAPAPLEIAAEDPQLIIYTSGTTGVPKGVVQTHGMLTWNSINTVLGWDLRSDDRTVLHAGMFYTAGWNVLTLPLVHCRGASVITQGFDADQVLRLVEEERLTLLFGVPTMFQMMLESPRFDGVDMSRLRFVVSGGAPLPAGIREAFLEKKGIRIWEGYGLTEVGPNNFLANGKPGTIGGPMLHNEVKLVDDEGRPVAEGEEGELLLRGDHVCAGYWRKPEQTAEAIRDGWFHTGDLARVDEDGHYAIVGRKKDMLISGGINVYPAEVEHVIEGHPKIASVAVIGVPDEKWGEVGKAVVEVAPGATLEPGEIQAFLDGRLAKYKIPKYVTVVSEIPRTVASGKIQKHLLKERHGSADES